ncbi:MAG: PQQ-binding-like beta-propeller repeat protein [Planctomycetales bacterium]|nr:PQQ-binding-like beta-propeller repeat protein [Planctomycetales bacterium]
MLRILRVQLAWLSLILIASSSSRSVAESPNWSSWRGPTADGHSSESDLPVRWGADSVKWKVALTGKGQSSPMIWEDRIFLTSYLEQGRQRLIACYHRTSGTKLWEKTCWTGQPEPTHEMNGWASASCVTDGQRVVAFFGRGGLHCYSVDGEHQWSRELGSFEGPWGTAASPILVGDLIVQNCDSDAGAFLLAVDKSTGEDVWRTARPSNRGWSTPVVINSGARDELVLNGHEGLSAYDPANGKLLWQCRCERGRGSPTVTPANGMLYVLNGLADGGAYCVRPGGSGDVTDTERVWITRRGGRDLSSPIVLAGNMLAMGLRSSILTAYDAKSGKELWNKRIGGQISASPIAYGGYAFFIDENGKTIVVDPNSAEKVIAQNTIGAASGELFRASITPFRSELFIRSNDNLYCISAGK